MNVPDTGRYTGWTGRTNICALARADLGPQLGGLLAERDADQRARDRAHRHRLFLGEITHLKGRDVALVVYRNGEVIRLDGALRSQRGFA